MHTNLIFQPEEVQNTVEDEWKDTIKKEEDLLGSVKKFNVISHLQAKKNVGDLLLSYY